MRKLLLILLISTGCISSDPKLGDFVSAVHDLDHQWAPLEEIRERPWLFRDLGSKTAISTIGKRAYVRDLEEWLGRVPVGSAKYESILRHEQEHSRRQLDMGTFLWVARYSYDKEFALLEEQIGYYYEITERRRLGGRVLPEVYAAVLSGYENLDGKLISFDSALSWVRAVLSGSWKPPE